MLVAQLALLLHCTIELPHNPNLPKMHPPAQEHIPMFPAAIPSLTVHLHQPNRIFALTRTAAIIIPKHPSIPVIKTQITLTQTLPYILTFNP